MDTKNIIKLGLGIVLITAGAILRDRALKEMGSKFIL